MMKRMMSLLAILTAVMLVLAACGDSDDESTTAEDEDTTTTAAETTTTAEDTTSSAAETTMSAEDTTTSAEEMDGEEAMDGETIVDIAAADENFSTLVAAVQAAGLTDALADPNATLTVFAPTNDAFAAALDSLGLTAEELLADTDTLTSILTYHVLDEVVTSADLAAAGTEEVTVTMLSGEDLTIVVGDAGDVTFLDQDATVTTADLEASNGVIHVIDGVLLPPSLG